MLSYEQLLHFAKHGWVLEEDVLDPRQIQSYKAGLDRLAGRYNSSMDSDEQITNISNMVLFDELFCDWIMIPRILEANKQLLGAALRYETCHAMIKHPHRERATRAEELRSPDGRGWHRGIRPKWGTFPDDNDPDLINCTFLNNLTYLTDVRPGDGGTMVLDGSHRLEGKYATLKDRCPVVETTARAGSILHFTESLIHTGMPILSENVRYTMFYGFTPPWFCNWPGSEVPRSLWEPIVNEELRNILGARTGYMGQEPEISGSGADRPNKAPKQSQPVSPAKDVAEGVKATVTT